MRILLIVVLILLFWIPGAHAAMELRVGHNIPVTDLPFRMALEQKLFTKYGLAVSTINRTPIDAPLVAGEVDCTVAANAASIVRLNVRGFKAKILATLLDSHIIAFVARWDFREERAQEELQRAPVGIISFTGAGYAAFKKAMHHYGLRETDVEPTSLQYPAMLAALQSRRLKAAAINISYLYQATSKLGLKVLLDFSDDAYPFSIVTCRNEFVVRHPEVVERFLKALSEAVWRVKTQQGEVDHLLKKAFGKSDPSERTYIYERLAKKFVTPGLAMIPSRLGSVAADEGLDDFNEGIIIDPSFLHLLQKNGFFSRFR